MKTLIVTSCTAKKMNIPGYAGVFYQGLQHRYVSYGVRDMRDTYGMFGIGLYIISAKHGLLKELDMVSPYNTTFNSMSNKEILSTARELQIHNDMSREAQKWDLIIYLLGKQYVQALELPLTKNDHTTHVFLLGSTYKDMIPDQPNYHFIDAGSTLAKELGVQNIALKGYIIKRLGEHIKEAENKVLLPAIMKNPEVLKLFIDALVLNRQDQLAEEKEKQVSLI